MTQGGSQNKLDLAPIFRSRLVWTQKQNACCSTAKTEHHCVMACPRRPLKALYWSPYPSVRVSLKWTNLRPRSKLRHTLGGHTLPSLVDHKCSSSPLNNSLWYEHNNGKDFICPCAGISLAFAACAQISCIISVHLFHLYCSANASVDNVEMIAAEEGSRPSLSWLWLPVRCPCPPLIDHCCYLVVVMMRMMRMLRMRIINCTSHCIGRPVLPWWWRIRIWEYR